MFVVIFNYSANTNLRDYRTVVPSEVLLLFLPYVLGIKRLLILSGDTLISYIQSCRVKTLKSSADLRTNRALTPGVSASFEWI